MLQIHYSSFHDVAVYLRLLRLLVPAFVCEKVTVSVQYDAKVTTLENTVSVHSGG